jgi:hypothetical protein
VCRIRDEESRWREIFLAWVVLITNGVIMHPRHSTRRCHDRLVVKKT